MSKRRLSDAEFAEVQEIINSPENDVGLAELQKRRDYLLDLSDMMKDAKDSVKYRIWAGNLDLQIKKLQKTAKP